MPALPTVVSQAHGAANAQEWQRAITLYSQYIDQPTLDLPTWSNALILRGLCRSELPDASPHDALADLTRAIESVANDTTAYRDAHYYRGCTLYLLDRFNEADADHQRYINATRVRLKPHLYHSYHLGVGTPVMFASARDACNYALSERPTHDLPRLISAIASAKLNDLSAARVPLALYIKYHSDTPAAALARDIQREIDQKLREIQPDDKSLMQPDMEYARYLYVADAPNATLEIYDHHSFRIEQRPHVAQYLDVLSGDGWQKTASISQREAVGAYFLRRKNAD